jgi:hypothetical protein
MQEADYCSVESYRVSVFACDLEPQRSSPNLACCATENNYV